MNLVITVAGGDGAGKTTIALLIEQALKEHGFTNVHFTEPEHTEFYILTTQKARELKCRDHEIKIEMVRQRRTV